MSTPLQERPGRGRRPARIPVAYPPAPPAPLSEPVPPLFANLGTIPALKSWGGSFAVHAAFLLLLAFWYFTPPARRPNEFDTRIGGSPDGVIDGTTFAGGLNTPEDEIGMAEASVMAEPEPMPLLDLVPAEGDRPAPLDRGAPRSAGGGAPNDNPGAGGGEGFGVARFGDGSESIKGVQVKVGDPQFTLIWDSDADLDLHVVEPGGKEIDWEDRKGDRGGELDVDNTRGYGPENIYWLTQTDGEGGPALRGDGPPGVYRWFVVYYGRFGGIPRPTQWQVRVKHDGRVSTVRGKLRDFNDRSKVYTLEVVPKVADDGPFLPPERP